MPIDAICPCCGKARAKSETRDAQILREVLPPREIYHCEDLARFFQIDVTSITYHARQRSARFAKSAGRWRWDGLDEVIPFCLFLIAVSFKARDKWKDTKTQYLSSQIKN